MHKQISEENVRLLGRCRMAEDGIVFNWTGSGILFRFYGTAAAIMLEHSEPNLAEWIPFLSVRVDGGEVRRVGVGNSALLPLCMDLPCGEHVVSVTKSSETGTYPLKIKFLQISAGEQQEAKLLPPPELPLRRIEFVGDSITCGFGNLGTAEQTSFLTAEEDGGQSYAGLAAAHFNADSRMICFSGRGIVHNCDGTTDSLIPQFYEKVLANEPDKWDFSKWQPDVVVINVGTNDDGGGYTSGDEMREGAAQFLKRVRECNPNAHILWCYGLMTTRLEPVIQEAVALAAETDDKIHYLALTPIALAQGEVGTCGHPNVRAHRRAAAALIQKISEITGW